MLPDSSKPVSDNTRTVQFYFLVIISVLVEFNIYHLSHYLMISNIVLNSYFLLSLI